MMDLDFISGDFLYEDLPRERQYLAKYFVGPVERRFLVYYITFNKLYQKKEDFLTFYNNFISHTGHCCSTRWVRQLLARIVNIEEALDKASKDFDLSLVGMIKAGHYKI
jgi:hypothetical protein